MSGKSFLLLPTRRALFCTNTKLLASNYIITFKSDTPADVLEQRAQDIEASGATITHRYNAALKGFAVKVPDTSVQALGAFNDDPHVDSFEADGEVTTQGQALLNK